VRMYIKVAISVVLTVLFIVVCGCDKTQTSPPIPIRSKAPTTFQAAKVAAGKIYLGNQVTFYCGCKYSINGVIDHASCGYKPRNPGKRSFKLEWEHVVPAQAFGKHRACWKGCDGLNGRMCCRKIDQQFRIMEADLMNLVPSVGEINGDRSSRPYGEVAGEPRAYGACDFEIDFKRDVVEPREGIRGDIARIYLHMHTTYPGGLPLSKEEVNQFGAWNAADPQDAWELRKIEKVKAIRTGRK